MMERVSVDNTSAHVSSSEIALAAAGSSNKSVVGKIDDEGAEVLPPDFDPGKWDVICQRGKECFDHVGNRRFRMCIEKHLSDYVKVKTRPEKSRIVSAIVESIRRGAAKTGGGFVRKDLLTRRWLRVGDKLAREKVGQALRDAIKTRRTGSSSPAPVSSVASSKINSLHATSQEFLGGVDREEEEGESNYMPLSASSFKMNTSNDAIQRRPSIIPGLNFQPLEPRGPEQQIGSTIGASGNLWSLLKADASEKLKDPTTFASFWEITSSAAASPTAAHQSSGGGAAATTNIRSKQRAAVNSLLAGGNEHSQGELFEPTPMPYQFGGCTLPTNLGNSGGGSISGSANLAYAPPLHMVSLEQQLHQYQQGERPRPLDVYRNSEASRKKVLGMFQHLLPPMEQQQQLPMEPLAQQSRQQQQQLQRQHQQVFGSVPLSMEGDFFGFPQTSNLQPESYNQSRRSSLDWYTQPASDDVFDVGKP